MAADMKTDPPAASKYQKKLPARVIKQGSMDVYDVIAAFGVTCPAIQHALKKLLCPGQRGHKDYIADLCEASVSVDRAIELAKD